MADAKISALTSATTPLAGTEVVPIVQSGVTKKVSVETLLPYKTSLGATLSSWATFNRVFQFGGGVVANFGNDNNSMFGSNTYYNGAFKYVSADTATLYRQLGGKHRFYVAPSGAADATITFIEALAVETNADVSVVAGNLAIGTAGKGVDFSVIASGIRWLVGTGSPEGVVTAAPGSLYTNSSGGALTTLYVKTSGTGNTGWLAK